MSNITIVAIPRKDDPVWKISSEKIPHLTLLHMEAPLDTNVSEIVSYVQHAVKTSIRQFGLTVSKRGILGDNDADVLFFEEDMVRPLREFRGLLLKDDRINKLWNGSEQFPGWIPHLTLGYPETPAKKVEDDRLYWISFGEIAVWTGDYTGPTFELEDYFLSETVHGISSLDHEGVEFYHFGVRGQRWGVRRALNSAGLVTGTVEEAIKSGQKPSANSGQSSDSPRIGRSSSSSESEDHKQMKESLTKELSSLSTNEIKELTKRIKAIKELEDTKKAQARANAPAVAKLAKWLASSAATGVRRTSEAWIQEVVSDLLKDTLPETKKQAGNRRKAQQDRENNQRPDAKNHRKENTSQNGSDKKRNIEDLINAIQDSDGSYTITNKKKK